MVAKPSPRIPTAPDLPPIEQLIAAVGLTLKDDSQTECVSATEISLAHIHCSHITIRESTFRSVDFTSAEFDFVQMTDVLFESCDMANARWNWLATERTVYSDCRLLGFKAIESEMLSVKFENCVMQLSQFRFARLAGAYFVGCDLKEADFSGADLSGATFEHCDLTGASFSEARCKGLDLRSSTIDGLTIGPKEMTGVIINPLQAHSVVQVFGVFVLDTDDSLPNNL